jgi:hypothetical protein
MTPGLVAPEGGLRTPEEQEAVQAYVRAFMNSKDPVEVRLANFPKFVRRQDLTRFLVLYELFKKVLQVKGSVVDCGVYRGFSLMAWAHFSAILEPTNLTRRIYGFDTFSGFPSVSEKDRSTLRTPQRGELSSEAYEELLELIRIYDRNRFLGHIPKVHLIRGDARETIPKFVQNNPHLVVSLLFLDFDLYEPTKVAIEHFVPRMPRGAVIAFDELDNPIWPGETQALLDTLGIGRLELRRLEWDPYIAYALIP